jgi:membrane glycosyltransferase
MLASIAFEAFFSMLLAPILMLAYTKFVLAALTGLRVHWGRQNRGEARPSWSEVLRTHGGQTFLGIAGLLAVLRFAPALLPWLAPVLAGQLVAVPFARFTSSEKLGDAARKRGLFLVPEETIPPPELPRVHGRLTVRQNSIFLEPPYATHFGLLQAVLDPYIHAVHVSLLRQRDEDSSRNRDYSEQLSQRLLAEGPRDLSANELTALLWDADAMGTLHKELWICSSDKLAPWWQYALRRYNETTAAAARRAMS